MITRWKGPSQSYQASMSFPLATLDKGKLLRSLNIHCNLTGTKGATDAVDGAIYGLWLQNVQCGPYLQCGGHGLRQLMEQKHGRIIMDPTDIPGSGTTFDVDFLVRWEPRQIRQQGANDGGLPTELLLDHELQITFAPTAITGGGTVTVTGGTIYLDAELCESEPGYNPQIVFTKQNQYSAQTITVEPGVILNQFLLDTAAGAASSITEAELSNVIYTLDGRPYWRNQTHEQIIETYNAEAVEDSAAELSVNTAKRFPLVWLPKRHGQLTKQPAIDAAGMLQLSGSQTSFTMVTERVVEKDPGTVQRIQTLTGGDPDADYKVATAKGNPVEATLRPKSDGSMPRKGRIAFRALPGKFKNKPV
jgi:hypothetical protein